MSELFSGKGDDTPKEEEGGGHFYSISKDN
jgi:hypothetical protein